MGREQEIVILLSPKPRATAQNKCSEMTGCGLCCACGASGMKAHSKSLVRGSPGNGVGSWNVARSCILLIIQTVVHKVVIVDGM